MRRKSRELALQILFQSEFTDPLTLDDLIRTHEVPETYTLDLKNYAKDLIRGVQFHKIKIDELIQQHSSHWKLERMATIDRNILRLSVFEMKFSSTPLSPAIVINEALEVAKIYSGADSASFINGVLDQIGKGL